MAEPRSTRTRRRPALVLLGLAAAVLVLLPTGGRGLIDALVRQMTYPAPPVPVPSPAPAPLQEVVLDGPGGALSAWWLAPDRAGAPVVLMLHGNGENLETMRQAGLFDDFARLGCGVLALDYPGYGRSDGSPSEASLVAAADHAWRWLVEQGEGSPRVVVGWSLGAAVAIQVAARHPDSVDGAVLLSPWNDLLSVAGRFFPAWLLRSQLGDRYDSVTAAAHLRCPSLVVHGVGDSVIPVTLGRNLYEALPEPKRWIPIEEAGHNDLLARPRVWAAIGEFLEGL